MRLPEIYYPVHGSQLRSRSITVVGRGIPGNTVEINLHGRNRAEATVLPNESWSYVFPGPFKPGYILITVRQKNSSGEESPEAWGEFYII
jgi:hypothetical protein